MAKSSTASRQPQATPLAKTPPDAGTAEGSGNPRTQPQLGQRAGAGGSAPNWRPQYEHRTSTAFAPADRIASAQSL
jgi:hypothetical protein